MAKSSKSSKKDNKSTANDEETVEFDDSQLFFVDTEPDANTQSTLDVDKDKDNSDNDVVPLTLPHYINLNDEDRKDNEIHTVRVLEDNNGEGDNDSIQDKEYEENDSDFVDIDQHNIAPARYFQEEVNRHEYTVCKSCKQTGHIAKDCPHIICLTCGAVDEHKERDCPISLVCYNCGGRGHFARNCTIPKQRDSRLSCRRCGSPNHQMRACPTLWRIYRYVDTEEFDNKSKSEVTDEAESKEIQEARSEMWCYNCADSGHLGDDCGMRRGCPIPLHEPSAFSEQNLISGPFKTSFLSDKKKKKETNGSRRVKQLEKSSGYPSNTRIPDRGGPGFERKRKEKEYLKRLADESSDDSDEYDNFVASVNGVGDGLSKKARANKRKRERKREENNTRSSSSNSRYDLDGAQDRLGRRRQDNYRGRPSPPPFNRYEDDYRKFKNLDRPKAGVSRSTWRGGYGKR